MKAANIIPGDKLLATDISVLQFSVPTPSRSSVSVKISIKPMKANSIQVEVMKMYLSAAPMFFGALSMTIRTAEKAVVNSASIQNNAKLSAKKV